MNAPLVLHGYWRSSAAYRVRLALGWKGLAFETVAVDLRSDVQGSDAYRALNPQALVPSLQMSGAVLGQSLAIMEYLDEVHPDPPLLPGNALARARVRSAALMVAADIHPINNLRVLRYLKSPLGQEQDAIDAWARHWIGAGFAALEAFAGQHGAGFLFGDRFTMADACLVPQLYNARRVDTDLSAYPRLLAIEARVAAMPFAAAAHPDAQTDAPPAGVAR